MNRPDSQLPPPVDSLAHAAPPCSAGREQPLRTSALRPALPLGTLCGPQRAARAAAIAAVGREPARTRPPTGISGRPESPSRRYLGLAPVRMRDAMPRPRSGAGMQSIRRNLL